MFKARLATNFEQPKVAFGTLIGDAASRSGLEHAVVTVCLQPFGFLLG